MTNAQKFWILLSILFTIFVSIIPLIIIICCYIFFCVISTLPDLEDDNKAIPNKYNFIEYINKYLNKF